MKKQYFALRQSKMADLVHALLCLKGDDPVSGEITKLVLKLGLADGLESPNKTNASLPSSPWGSPKLRKSVPDSSKTHNRSSFRIKSLFERKTPPSEGKSSFYVDVEEPRSDRCEQPLGGGGLSGSLTAESHEGKSYAPSVSCGSGLDPFSTPSSVLHGQGQGDLIQFRTAPENTSISHGTPVPVRVCKYMLDIELCFKKHLGFEVVSCLGVVVASSLGLTVALKSWVGCCIKSWMTDIRSWFDCRIKSLVGYSLSSWVGCSVKSWVANVKSWVDCRIKSG